MGMTITPRPPATAPARGGARWLPERVQTQLALRRLALASVVANIVIVVTGGAVRLSDSGLGCPTWPSCTDASLTPTRQYAIHGIIEFTNRQLTFVLVIVAVATWLVAMARRQERSLATWAALGIPAQAILGGFTVLTHLNPWLVAGHFMLSMGIVAVTTVLWWRLRDNPPAAVAPPPVAWLARAVAAATLAALAIGTIVTGSGPHAGATDANGKVHRTGLKVSSMAQLHADSVMVLIGLTVGLLALVYAVQTSAAVRRSVVIVLVIELAQGIIGYTQYFLHVPPLLVGLHMLGASVLWFVTLSMLLTMHPSSSTPSLDADEVALVIPRGNSVSAT